MGKEKKKKWVTERKLERKKEDQEEKGEKGREREEKMKKLIREEK